MKILTVDFTNDVPVISTRYGGELGEHQAVSLNIIPEKSMTEDEDLQFYYVLFKVDGGLVASRTFSQGEDIEIALWGQLTENRRLSFQLIGTNGTETIIAKTPILTLSLGDSLVGTVIGIDDNRDSLIAMIGAFNERLDDDEEKLDTIETGAEENIIEQINDSEGNPLPIVDKVVTLPDSSAIELVENATNLKYNAFEIRDLLYAGKSLLMNGQPLLFIDVGTNFHYFYVGTGNTTVTVYRMNQSGTFYYKYWDVYLVRDPNAEQNKINAIKTADGTTLPISSQTVTLPDYALVSALTNYYTKLETYSKTEVDNLIGQISALSIEIVQTLPTQDIKTNVIYLVPKTGSTNDVYDEYMYINNAWEHIGSTDVDLSNYYTKTEIDNKGYLTSIPTASTSTLGGVKVDGTSISIDANGVISSSGGGGASAMIVTFTTENDDIVSDYTIHEIVTAHDSGSVVLGKMMDEDAGIEFVFNLSAAIEVEGIAIAEFTSMFDSGDDAIIVSIFGINEGEGDTWQGLHKAIPEEITTTTSVSQYSTDDEVPTAKAVYDYVPKADLIITAESSVSVLEFINQDLTNFNIQYNSTMDEMLAKLNVHKMLTVDGGVICPMTELDLSFENYPNSFAQAPWHIIACAKIDNGWLTEMGYVESNTKDGVWIRILAEYNTGSTSTNAQIRWSPKTKKDLLIYEDDNGVLTYDGYIV